MPEPIIQFREYQRPVFGDNETGVLVLHWSRQIGKSFTLAAWAVDRLLTRPGRLVTVLSNSKDNGQEFALKCAEVCRKFDEAKKRVIEQYGLKDLSTSVEYSDMRFEIAVKVKGRVGRIKVLAANPRTARGFSGDLILDEFAFHEDSAAIWDAAEPILSSNPDFLCRVASTGNGTGNMFYRMATEGRFKVSRVRRSDAWRMGVRIYDAKTRRPITPEEARAQALDKASYDQNYECAFASETGALLTHELINRAVNPDGVIIDGDAIPDEAAALLSDASREIYFGGDLACTHDFSVLPLAVKEGSSLRIPFIWRIRGSRLPAQEDFIARVISFQSVRRAAFDSSGIGLGLVQHLQDDEGHAAYGWKVEGVNFSTKEPVSRRVAANGHRGPMASVREIMATELVGEHEDGRITYPCDAVMRDDIRKPQKIRTSNGRETIAAESTKTGHADHFWGLALVIRAASFGTAWTFDPVVVAPDAGASGAIGTYDNFTSRKLD